MRASVEMIAVRVLTFLVIVSVGLACELRTPLGSPPDASLPTGDVPAIGAPRISADGGATAPTATPTPVPVPVPATMAQAEQEMMARWNRAADRTPTILDFHWGAFDQFPHPTFKGGTADGYRQFARVLLAFLQQDDNFDFLARNHLFTTRLRYVFPSGQVGLDTSFQELAVYFSSSMAFGDIPVDTRAALKTVADRIQQAT